MIGISQPPLTKITQENLEVWGNFPYSSSQLSEQKGYGLEYASHQVKSPSIKAEILLEDSKTVL